MAGGVKIKVGFAVAWAVAVLIAGAAGLLCVTRTSTMPRVREVARTREVGPAVRTAQAPAATPVAAPAPAPAPAARGAKPAAPVKAAPPAAFQAPPIRADFMIYYHGALAGNIKPCG